MSKKHKKIFKQKIKEMLSQMEKEPKTPLPPPPPTPVQPVTLTPPPQIPEPKPPKISTPVSSVTSLPIVKSDLKKITLTVGIMILILIASFMISLKTNWLFILADKLYNLAQLGG